MEIIGFCRVGPSKNRSGERLRTETARKNDKNRFRRRFRTHFCVPGLIFCRFWGPGWTPKLAKNRSGATRRLFFDHTFPIFWRFVRSGVFRKRPGSILEAPRTLPDEILLRFCKVFLVGSVGILSWFVGFRREVAGIHRRSPELTLRGFSGVRRSRGAN